MFQTEMTVGTTYWSRRAKEVLVFDDVRVAIALYSSGDWGDVTRRIAERNIHCVRDEGQVIGFYRDRNKQGFWIITETLHKYTEIKLADEHWDEH